MANEELLCQSCRDGDVGGVKKFLSEGSDINHCKGLPLTTAAQNGRRDVVKLLLEMGVDFSYAAEALSWAARKGHLECVVLLVEHGVDIHADSDYSVWLARKGGHGEVVRFLEEQSKVQNSAFKLNSAAREILLNSGSENSLGGLPKETKSHIINRCAESLVDKQVEAIIQYASTKENFYKKEAFLKNVLYANGQPSLEPKASVKLLKA